MMLLKIENDTSEFLWYAKFMIESGKRFFFNLNDWIFKLLKLQQYKTSFHISFDTSNRKVIPQNSYRPIFRKKIFIYKKKSYGAFKEKNVRLKSFLEHGHIGRRPWTPIYMV